MSRDATLPGSQERVNPTVASSRSVRGTVIITFTNIFTNNLRQFQNGIVKRQTPLSRIKDGDGENEVQPYVVNRHHERRRE